MAKKKKKIPLKKKWTNDLNNFFSKEDIQIVNKYIKMFSTSLIIGKRKSEMQYHLIPLKWQLQKDNKCVAEM